MTDFSARIIADSVNVCGNRLVTFEVTYPRSIHAEMLTHRLFSRNSASSRAIPVETMLASIVESPFIPRFWGKNQRGMQAGEEVDPQTIEQARAIILKMRDFCVDGVRQLAELGLHKQLVNRYVEPWMWITVIISTTSFEHFRRLRVHPDAEPHFNLIASMMAKEYDTHEPTLLQPGHWHVPMFGFDEDDQIGNIDTITKVATGRCARVSYLTHNGTRDIEKDVDLHDRLMSSGHWSPFEHIACARADSEPSGNFVGFTQYRKLFPREFTPDQPYRKDE